MNSNRCGHRNPMRRLHGDGFALGHDAQARGRLRARYCARQGAPAKILVRAPTYYYLVNDRRGFEAGKEGTLMRERAPIARSPNRGGYHEDESLCVGRFVGPDLFARHAPAARFDSSCWAVCRRISFARGNLYGSRVGDAGDPIWAVLANASGGAAHAARITLPKHAERSRQFLGGYHEEGELLRERDSLLEI
jgi:hypothetical protein